MLDANATPPGFDGSYGWITITEANVIFPKRKTWNELGFELLQEAVAPDGTIFVLLQKISK